MRDANSGSVQLLKVDPELARGLDVPRAREAAAHSARLQDVADLAAQAAGGLHEVNQNAKQPEVM